MTQHITESNSKQHGWTEGAIVSKQYMNQAGHISACCTIFQTEAQVRGQERGVQGNRVGAVLPLLSC